MNRRAFVSATSSAVIGRSMFSSLVPRLCPLEAQVPQSATNRDPQNAPGQPEEIGRWMEAWNTRGYQGPLILSRFAEPIYFLYSPIRWKPSAKVSDRDMAAFTVPKGFVTDLTSIPRLFWSSLRPDGNYAYAAILHDYLYWVQTRPRKAADEIFRKSMEDFNVSPATREAIYLAVRVGGEMSWNDNAKRKAQGERRVLIKFPNDPTTSWAVWKQNQDHFRRSI